MGFMQTLSHCIKGLRHPPLGSWLLQGVSVDAEGGLQSIFKYAMDLFVFWLKYLSERNSKAPPMRSLWGRGHSNC